MPDYGTKAIEVRVRFVGIRHGSKADVAELADAKPLLERLIEEAVSQGYLLTEVTLVAPSAAGKALFASAEAEARAGANQARML